MIERIDIRLLESIGLEQRGNFYDPIGTLRDVGQNHLLAMLAAIVMDYPERLEADAIRNNRANVLKTLKPWTDEEIQKTPFEPSIAVTKTLKECCRIRKRKPILRLKPSFSILDGEEFRYLWKRGKAWRRRGKK